MDGKGNKAFAISALVSFLAIVAVIVLAFWAYNNQYVPQEKRADVRFTLSETARMLDRAMAFNEEHKDEPAYDYDSLKSKVKSAGEKFRDAWDFYDEQQYDDALESLRSARQTIEEAFPPDQVPSIYYYPTTPYPEEF